MRFLIAVVLISMLLLIANCQNDAGTNPTSWQEYSKDERTENIGEAP